MQIKLILLTILSFSMLTAQEDHTLGKLCKNGVENNPRIKSFSHKTSASYSYYDQSIDQYKPKLNISGSLSEQRYTLAYPQGNEEFDGLNHQYNVSINQAIYRATLLNAMDDAKERTVLAELMEEDEKAKLTAQILQSSFDLIKLKKTIAILAQKETLLEKAYKNIQKKHTLKLSSKVEQYQALSMLKQSHSDLAIAKQQYSQTLFNLKLLTKIDDAEKYVKALRFNIDAIERSFKELYISELKSMYGNNTRLRLEKQTVKIAKGQIDLRSSERYPALDAVVSYGDSGGTLDATVRQDDTRAMLTLNFPIYQGGYITDRVQEARALALAAESTAEDLEMNIKISLERAIQDIRSGLESIKAEKVAVAASKKYFEAASESYKNGLGSLTDAYLAESDFHDQRLRLISTQYRIYRSLAEIYYYTGIANYKEVEILQKKYLK